MLVTMPIALAASLASGWFLAEDDDGVRSDVDGVVNHGTDHGKTTMSDFINVELEPGIWF